MYDRKIIELCNELKNKGYLNFLYQEKNSFIHIRISKDFKDLVTAHCKNLDMNLSSLIFYLLLKDISNI